MVFNPLHIFLHFPKLIISLSFVFFALVSLGQGQSDGSFNSVLSYSLTALTSSYDGRASALGGASVSTMADASAPYLNVAKTVFHSKKYGLSISYSPILFDILGFDIHAAVTQFFYNFGKSNGNSVSGGFQFLNYGITSATDNNGQTIADYSPSQISGFLGYARRIGQFSFGASFQFVSQNLLPSGLSLGSIGSNTLKSTAFAGNLGLYYSSGDPQELMRADVSRFIINAGLSLKNIGPKIDYLSVSTFQPATLNMGVSVVHPAGINFIFQHSLEFTKLLVPLFPSPNTDLSQEEIDGYYQQSLFTSYGKAIGELGTTTIRLGVEAYIVPARLFVRLGGNYGRYLFNQEGVTVTAGLGYKYLDYGIHFAYNYTPWSISKSSLFVTLFWDLGGYIEEDTIDTFDLDFFSVEDLFPELE